MTRSYEIKDLAGVLQNSLGSNKKIKSYETKCLTSGGDNYGSLMLSLDVSVVDIKTDKEEILHLVAKMLPLQEIMRELFNVQVTFKKEVAVYTVIAKEVKKFAKEHKFERPYEFLANFYGSRNSLDPNSDKVDEDAVIILENLKYSGYTNEDRITGFDIETAKVILKDLAEFHGIPLAYKLHKPTEFKHKFMEYLGPGMHESADLEMIEQMYKKQLEIASKVDPKCAQLKEKILKAFQSTRPTFDNNCDFSDPFGTICHLDFWVNNVMVKFENGKAIKSKLVDFQVLSYANLARDVVFFLFTSVPSALEANIYNELIEYYHSQLIKVLEKFNCNTKQHTLKQLHEEISKEAKSTEILHITTMLNPILAEKGTVDMENIDFEKMINYEGSDYYKKRLTGTLLRFAEMNWV